MIEKWRQFVDWLFEWHAKRSVDRLFRDMEAYHRLLKERPDHKGPLPRGYR